MAEQTDTQQLGKLEFKLGDVYFTADGSEEWLARQLDKVLLALERAPKTAQPKPPK
jgi:hypothetical protein